jgi:hypothetical protein
LKPLEMILLKISIKNLKALLNFTMTSEVL